MKVRVVFGLLVLGLLGGKLGADCVTRCIEASGSYHKRARLFLACHYISMTSRPSRQKVQRESNRALRIHRRKQYPAYPIE